MNSDSTERMIEETHSGVSVKVKSKRGSGTRDQDTVTIEAHYDDLGEASTNVEWLNDVLKDQLGQARRNDPGDDREEEQ